MAKQPKPLKIQQKGKIVKHLLYIFLLNNYSLSELPHSTEADEKIEKLKCRRFDFFDFGSSYALRLLWRTNNSQIFGNVPWKMCPGIIR